jgi:hypothetical protein
MTYAPDGTIEYIIIIIIKGKGKALPVNRP